MMPATGRCTEHEQNRRTAYAAVTASLQDDRAMIAGLVHELIQQPIDAADALLALIQACNATTQLWAKTIEVEPGTAWAKYAENVALAACEAPHNCDRESNARVDDG